MNENIYAEYGLLFVEDEKAIRENYIHYLKRYFNNIYEAEDGETAYKIYLEKKPKIMIVDINLPGISGVELVKKIRNEDHSTKIIMLTAQSDVKTLLAATEMKLTRYLVKPVSRSEFQDALDTVLDEISKFSIVNKKIVKLSNEYSWDNETNELKYGEEIIPLTNKESLFMEFIFTNPQKIHKYQDIILHVWPDTYEDKTSALKTMVKNVRRKLPEECIKNVFGIGYKVQIE